MTAVTKSIALSCEAGTAWRFLADGGHWPRWAIRNVLESRPVGENRWEIRTPRGPGVLRIRGVEAHGILDHDFIDPKQGTWTVPARVVPLSNGCAFMMTLERPAGVPPEAFERGLQELDVELNQLARLSSHLS